MSTDTEHCPKCGATVERYDRFCARCGADLRAPADATTVERRSETRDADLRATADTTTVERRSETRDADLKAPADATTVEQRSETRDADLRAPADMPTVERRSKAGVTDVSPEASAEMLRLGEQLPVGTIELDLDEALSGAFGAVSAGNAESVITGELAAKLPPEAQGAADALAAQVVMMLEAYADATGATLPEALQDLARSQAVLQVEVTEDTGKRHVSMNMTSRSTSQSTFSPGPRLPAGGPRSGCQFTILRLMGLLGAVGFGAIHLLLSR